MRSCGALFNLELCSQAVSLHYTNSLGTICKSSSDVDVSLLPSRQLHQHGFILTSSDTEREGWAKGVVEGPDSSIRGIKMKSR